MAWDTYKISEDQMGRNMPAISIGHNRLGINVAACELLNQKKEQFTHVQFLTDKQRPKSIGMRFWKYETNDCVPLSQKENKGKPIGGLEVVNALLLKEIFPKYADKKTVTKFKVHSEGNYILVIDMD